MVLDVGKRVYSLERLCLRDRDGRRRLLILSPPRDADRYLRSFEASVWLWHDYQTDPNRGNAIPVNASSVAYLPTGQGLATSALESRPRHLSNLRPELPQFELSWSNLSASQQ